MVQEGGGEEVAALAWALQEEHQLGAQGEKGTVTARGLRTLPWGVFGAKGMTECDWRRRLTIPEPRLCQLTECPQEKIPFWGTVVSTETDGRQSQTSQPQKVQLKPKGAWHSECGGEGCLTRCSSMVHNMPSCA